MKTKPFVTGALVPFLASLLLLAGSAGAAEIKVMTSGLHGGVQRVDAAVRKVDRR